MIAAVLERLARGHGVPARARAPRRSLPVPRLGTRATLALLAAVTLLGGVYLWLRDSSLVAVERVSVSGESGPDAGQIRRALIDAARNMTTLDVNVDALRMAVAPYPVVRDLRVGTRFPHGMIIRVIEQVPVGVVSVGGRTLAVAGDGTLLHDVTATAILPTIPLRVPPGGTRLSDRDALSAVALLAAAPYQLLDRVSQVTTVAEHGLVAQLRDGPSIYFGDPARLAAKWIAAAAVLTDQGSAGAVYIDVTDPERPAAGAGAATGAGATTSPGSATPAGSAGATGPGSAAPAGPAAVGASGATSTTPPGG